MLLVALGVWGGIIPFVGPLAGYAYTPDTAWTFTMGRLWLEILPAAAAVLGGLMLLGSANRGTASFGGWLAAAGGAWFVVGTILTPLWGGTGWLGHPIGGQTLRIVEEIGFFAGLGVAIVFLAALALGRFAVRGVRDVQAGERRQADRYESEPGLTDTLMTYPERGQSRETEQRQ
ncbi:MAG: hypothetical protein ACRDN9_01400 [Streptosporangiaceae bacterium]